MGEYRIAGFKMFSWGTFPYCKRTGKPEDEVTVELYEVDDNTLVMVDRLEGYHGPNHFANMYDRDTITLEGQDAYIYTSDRDIWGGEKSPVLSGDWNEYSRSKYNRKRDAEWKKFF